MSDMSLFQRLLAAHPYSASPPDRRESILHKLANLKPNSHMNARDKDGNTALHRALMNPKCDLDIIRILAHTENINTKNHLWHTPLHCAIIHHCDQYPVLAELLRHGANVNAKDRNGSTPLHKAVENPKCTIRLINMLLVHGAYVDAKQFCSEIPLMVAIKCIGANLPIIEKLMYNGCLDICANHTQNHKALGILVSNLDLVQMFLQHAVSPANVLGDENIIDFCCNDSVCGFQSVRDEGIRRTDLATSFLQYVVRLQHFNLDIVEVLLKRNACLYTKNCRNRSVIEYALRNPYCSLELIKLFFKYDTHRGIRQQFNVFEEKENSLLHLAVSNRDCPADVVKEILTVMDKDVLLNKENRLKQTPLDCAADLTNSLNCNLEVIELLLILGSRIRKTCLDMSVLWKNIQVLGGKDASRKVLECTNLLVKYALIEKKKGPVYEAFNMIVTACNLSCGKDEHGYFVELKTHLNLCFNEIMCMMYERIPEITLYEFVMYRCPMEDKDISQEVFNLLLSNQYPLYRKLMVFYFKKEVLTENVMKLNITIGDGQNSTVTLTPYCLIERIAEFLENEDLYQLYFAFYEQNADEDQNHWNQIEEILPPDRYSDCDRPRKKCRLALH